MATGTISVGGLATGLDTKSIIDQLVQLEHRPLDLLAQQITDIQNTQGAVGSFGGRLASISSAATALSTLNKVLVRAANSSNTGVLVAAAGEGAARGSTTINVTQLARGSVAGATTGVTSASDTVSNGAGTFQFQVGSGALQTVNIDGSTTLQGLADAINAVGAGVTASAVNLGTQNNPDFRLQIVSQDTGTDSTIAVVHDDTSLAVQTTQAGRDAQFTLTGFGGTFSRSTNTFSDVLNGVTVTLKDLGTSTVTVSDDADTIVGKVRSLVAAFNGAVTFVDSQSDVSLSDDKSTLTVGTLATDSTVKRLASQLHAVFSEVVTGATTQYVNLSSLGLATQKDGTILFDESAFRTALASNPTAVAQVLAGNGTANGVANDLRAFIDNASGAGGALSIHTQGLTDQITQLQAQIDVGQRNVDAFALGLQQQFASLESTVNALKIQSSFLSQAFK